MTNCCFYYILLIYVTNACSLEDFIIDDLELESSESVDDSGDDDLSESGLRLYQDVCDLPIDAGDCNTETWGNQDNDLSGVEVQELQAIKEIYDIKELYKVNNQFGLKKLSGFKDQLKLRNPNFGYNSNTEKCQEFNYEGCGGNDNRFETLKKCRKTCYNPLKYFLSEVTDLLLFKIANSPANITT